MFASNFATHKFARSASQQTLFQHFSNKTSSVGQTQKKKINLQISPSKSTTSLHNIGGNNSANKQQQQCNGTPYQQGQQMQQQSQTIGFRIRCLKHTDKTIEKICLHPNCDFDILFCTDCYYYGQSHINAHHDTIMNFSDFINVCRQQSLQYKDNTIKEQTRKATAGIVKDLDSQVTKYRSHVKHEEDKIDKDFDLLIQQFIDDITDFKNKLKEHLHQSLNHFIQLTEQIQQMQKELLQNGTQMYSNYQNEFDDFLTNLNKIQEKSGIPQSNQQQYNFKKMLTTIMPAINKIQQQIFSLTTNSNTLGISNSTTSLKQVMQCCSSTKNSTSPTAPLKQQDINAPNQQQVYLPQGNNQSKQVQQQVASQDVQAQINANSNTSSSSQVNFQILVANNLQYQAIFQAYNDLLNLENCKPFYRNLGDANTMYKNAFEDIRKIYYTLFEANQDFISVPQLNYCRGGQGYQDHYLSNIENESPQYNKKVKQIGCPNSNHCKNNSMPNCVYIDLINNKHNKNQKLDQLKQQKNACFNNTDNLKNNINVSSFNNNYYANTNQSLPTEQTLVTNLKTEQDYSFQLENAPIDVLPLEVGEKLNKIDFVKQISTNHQGGIFCCQIIDEQTLLTGSSDKTMKVWNLQDLSLKKTVQFKSDIASIAQMSGNDKQNYIIVGLFKSFAVVNMSFDIIRTIDTLDLHEASINCLSGCPDGQTVITASNDPKILCWRVFEEENKPKKYFDHRDSIYAMELINGKKNLATAGKDKTIKIWSFKYSRDQKGSEYLEKLALDINIQDAHKTDVTSLRASKQFPHYLVSGAANGEIKIWDIQHEGALVKQFKNYSGWIYKIILLERPYSSTVNQVGIQYQQQKSTQHKMSNQTKDNNCQNNCFTFGGNTLQHSQSMSNVSPQAQCSNKFQFKDNQNKGLVQQSSKEQLDNQHLNNLYLLTASIDGTLKVWQASQQKEICSAKMNNFLYCYPFGGVTAMRMESTNKIHIITSGNKSDNNLSIFTLK